MKSILLMVLATLLVACNNSGNTGQFQVLENRTVLLEKLYQRHEQWHKTPYVLGGLSRQGVDCSGFVQLTFMDEFDVQLPRTTAAQASLDREIPKHQLRSGDLLFFMIPDQGKLYHVGIYLEQGRFLHASTSQGVIISDLTTIYWRDNYWKSIRVLP